MSACINLSCIKPVHPVDALPPPPTASTSPFLEKLKIACAVLLSVAMIFFFCLSIVCGIQLISLDNKAPKLKPIATFKIESLSVIPPHDMSGEEHWNITLQVENNLIPASRASYNVTNIYLSLYRETIAMGYLSAFDVLPGKETIINGTLNSLVTHTEDTILPHLSDLWMNIVTTVMKDDPQQGPRAVYETLRVECVNFQGVNSSTTQRIQLQTAECIFGSIWWGYKEDN